MLEEKIRFLDVSNQFAYNDNDRLKQTHNAGLDQKSEYDHNVV